VVTRGVVPATAVGAALAPAGIDMPRGEATVVSLRSARAALVAAVAAVRDIIMVRCGGPARFAGAGAAAVGVQPPATV
jgi:hypothetical protein